MFGRMMIVAGLVATAGMGVAAVLGYRGAADGEPLQVHILVGLGSLLVFLLAHSWVAFYLAGAARILAGTGTVEPAVSQFHRRTLPALFAAVVLALGTFLLGIVVYDSGLSGWIHGAPFYATVAAELWAARSEWTAVTAVERGCARAAA